jgi:mono/diheme cytochrome c family protein
MILDIVVLLVFLALIVLVGWLAKRAWGSQRAWLKWIGVIVAGLVTLIFAVLFVVGAIGFARLNLPQSNPVTDVQVAGTPDQIAHGQKLALLCTACHATTEGRLPLDGGTRNFVGPLGMVVPPNLTPAGPLKSWSGGEIIRAIREGVANNGRALIVMPSDQFHGMSDADVQSLVAYLRSQPAVQHDTPANALSPLGMLLVGAGIFSTSAQAPITQPVVAPPAGVTVDYGKYLVGISGCRACHGADLAGGTPGGFTPVGPNLTAIVPKWSQSDFVKTIRTGVDPTGHALTPDQMPWKLFDAMYTDDELGAIYTYLHSLTLIVKPAK